MNSYELIYATIPNLEKENIEELHDAIRGYISASKGELKTFNEWGLKKLAYPIQDFFEAPYYFLEIDLDPSKIEELKNILRLNSATLRSSIIKIEKDFTKRKISKKRPPRPAFDRPKSNYNNNAPRNNYNNNYNNNNTKREFNAPRVENANAPKKEIQD